MSRSTRIVADWGLLLVGAAGVLLFFGRQVPTCLGPLGVTPVQCYKAHGLVPEVGVGALLGTIVVRIGLRAAGAPGRRAD